MLLDLIWDDDDVNDIIMLIMQDSDTDNSSSDDEMLDSDDEESTVPHVWGSGSRVGKAPNVDRRRVFYSHLLFNDFWGPSPVYDSAYFKRFFKLPIGLFDEIVTKVVAKDRYFLQKKDAVGRLGLSELQKICSAVRQLTSGVSSSEHDDKYRMGSSTGLESLKRFCNAVISVYGKEALRHPTAADIDRLLDEGCQAGFPGCIGSIDCMHWEWKNCPSGWKGMFQGKSGVPTMVLEAIADNRCRFWHFNFGSPGSLNDLNILDRSPLFENAVKGESPSVNFVVNGNEYNYAYWLGDGIYPKYACFVKTFAKPQTRMQKMFASAQEAKRKDIERAFGMLQSRFHILTTPCRLWNQHAMKTVIATCVILHNLIVDYKMKNNLDSDYIEDEIYVPSHPFTVIPRDVHQTDETRSTMVTEMQCSDYHTRLQHDLMIERWQMWSEENDLENSSSSDEEEYD